MIWAAISINGWQIVGIRITRVHLRMDRRGLITTACRMSCARDPGRTIRVMFDPPAVITTTQAYAIQLTAYVLHIPYDSGPPSASLGLTPRNAKRTRSR